MTTTSQFFTSSATFTAPATLLDGAVVATVYGAIGAGSGGEAGAAVKGTIAMSAGGTLALTVGTNGGATSGTAGAGYHNGGPGGNGIGSSGGGGGRGGGSSAIVQGSTLMIEAGGGGGKGGSISGYEAGVGGSGGLVATGGANGLGSTSGVTGKGGKGANNASGGAGGAAGTDGSHPGTAGSAGTSTAGGAGGNAGSLMTGSNSGGGGGGGGGGHAGGGGGGGGSTEGAGGGGGGGSSYAAPAVSSVSYLTGGSTEYGSVEIEYTYADVPYAPTLISPADGAYAEMANTPQIVFRYQPGTDSGTLATWALRRKLSTGSTYNYWNASAGNWTSTTPVWNSVTFLTIVSGTSGAITYGYTFPTGSWTDGNTYNYSVATAESNYPTINQGPFATDFTVNATVAPVVTITSPGSMVQNPAISVQWTVALGSGTSQISYRIVIYTAAQAAEDTFQIGISPGVYDSGVVASAATSATVAATAPNPEIAGGSSYVLGLQVAETGGAQSNWAMQDFTADFGGPAIPTLSVSVANDPTTLQPVATLTATIELNQIPEGDSDFELGSIAGWSGTNVNLSTTTVWAADGISSLHCVSVAAGACEISDSGLSGCPTAPGQVLTVMGTVQAPSSPHSTQLEVWWYDDTGTFLGKSNVGSAVTPTTTGVQMIGQITTPATVGSGVPALASVAATWTAGAANNVANFDCFGIFYGVVTQWSLGGFAISTNTTALEFQYSDDGVTWTDCRFNTDDAIPFWPAAPMLSIVDTEMVTDAVRSYRVRGTGYSILIGGTVGGEWSEVVTGEGASLGYAFLSDPTVAGSAIAGTMATDWKPAVHEEMTRYYPIGRPLSVKSTDGTKGLGGTFDFQLTTNTARHALEALLEGDNTLLLQLPGESYYISGNGDRTAVVKWTTMGISGNNQSVYTIPYMEADAP